MTQNQFVRIPFLLHCGCFEKVGWTKVLHASLNHMYISNVKQTTVTPGRPYKRICVFQATK